MTRTVQLLGVLVALLALTGCGTSAKPEVELLNVSYDPTRELWRALNEKFVESYRQQTGTTVSIKQSHGGSGSQARAVIDGLEADVVTLAMWTDTNAIAQAGLIDPSWPDRLPNGALPYFSTIVFVVRQGNPKGIKDWPDLVRGDVQVITPSPKTSANGKLTLLAAWGSVIERGGSESEAQQYLHKLYQHAPVLDPGARAATTTFAQKGIGDVHVTWENEAFFEVEESGNKLEIVYPSVSIRAEPRVAVVDKNVDRKKTRAVAEAYLEFLYTPEAQEIIAQHHYRPFKPEVLQKYSKSFRPIKLFTIHEIARNWQHAQERFFADGGIFDQIYVPGK
jgi:sulfate transport system substrate-binding protein